MSWLYKVNDMLRAVELELRPWVIEAWGETSTRTPQHCTHAPEKLENALMEGILSSQMLIETNLAVNVSLSDVSRHRIVGGEIKFSVRNGQVLSPRDEVGWHLEG